MKNRNLDHKDDWMTPPEYYEKWDKIYGFDFDPCPFKHDIEKWDGLKIAWGKMNFVNPPYSLRLKTDFVKKAIFEFINFKRKSILLLPVATGARLFQNNIYNIFDFELLPGRIPFIGYNQKGQKVNWHLIEETKNDLIEYKGDLIPLHKKANGQHDSMLVKIF